MFKIVSDGSCEYSEQIAIKNDVHIVPFYVTFDGTTYLKEGIDIKKEEYFNRLVNEKNTFPKTSQPSPQDYIEAYTPFLKEGKDIISITISSKLSGSYQSAVNAAKELKETFPERKIIVIDSLSVSVGVALILNEMIKLRDSGHTIEDTSDFVLSTIKDIKLYFTLDSLEYLQRGGRIGKGSALLGGLLNLKPILSLTNGEVGPLTKVRGKKKALDTIIEYFETDIKGKEDDFEYAIVHIVNDKEAVEFKNKIIDKTGKDTSMETMAAGVTIGTHAGPGGIGLALIRKYKGT